MKAYRVQDKVRGVGFDWDNADQVWDKVQEELGELRTELEVPERDAERVTDEFGDVMFALINYARFVDVNPDEALERTTRRFMARFQHLENAVREEERSFRHDARRDGRLLEPRQGGPQIVGSLAVCSGVNEAGDFVDERRHPPSVLHTAGVQTIRSDQAQVSGHSCEIGVML